MLLKIHVHTIMDMKENYLYFFGLKIECVKVNILNLQTLYSIFFCLMFYLCLLHKILSVNGKQHGP